MLELRGTAEIPHLVISRPGRANSVTTPLLRELKEHVERFSASDAIALILTGDGGRFCSGADLDEVQGHDRLTELDEVLAATTAALATAPILTVAAVERYAHGAGVDLAWSCDVVVAADDLEISVPAARLGILYHPVSVRRLRARLGSRAIRQLLVAGRTLDGADHADVVTGAGGTLAAAERIAAEAAGIDRQALAASKSLLNELDHDDAGDWTGVRERLIAARSERGPAG